MSAEAIASQLERWFLTAGSTGLKLPDGWFGRPHDTLFRAMTVLTCADRLIVVLDDRAVLTLAHPVRGEASPQRFRIEEFAHASWDWDGYGSDGSHLSGYERGTVEFVA